MSITLTRPAALLLLAAAYLCSASATPAWAGFNEWTERRNGCSYTCHWYLTSGTCSGPFGVRVPCPLKKKRCSTDYCTQVSH